MPIAASACQNNEIRRIYWGLTAGIEASASYLMEEADDWTVLTCVNQTFADTGQRFRSTDTPPR